MEMRGEAGAAARAGAAIVIVFVGCRGICGNFGWDRYMQDCHDNINSGKAGKAHCYYCHSLQLRGLLLS